MLNWENQPTEHKLSYDDLRKRFQYGYYHWLKEKTPDITIQCFHCKEILHHEKRAYSIKHKEHGIIFFCIHGDAGDDCYTEGIKEEHEYYLEYDEDNPKWSDKYVYDEFWVEFTQGIIKRYYWDPKIGDWE